MKRRSFLHTSFAAVCSTATTSTVGGAESSHGLVYELRTYSLKAAKQPLLEAYLSKAFLPSLKRFGIAHARSLPLRCRSAKVPNGLCERSALITIGTQR